MSLQDEGQKAVFDCLRGTDELTRFEDAAASDCDPRESRERVRAARCVQDAHSVTEQAVYDVLWRKGKPGVNGNRTVTVGLGELSKLARLSESTCRRHVRSLSTKLAIEEIAPERCADRVGKSYLVFCYSEILKRRKAAGLVWVVRGRSVRFVGGNNDQVAWVAGHPAETEGAPLSGPAETNTDVTKARDTNSAVQMGKSMRTGVAVTEGGFGKSAVTGSDPTQGQEQQQTSAIIAVTRHCIGLGISTDDAAAREIIARCKAVDPSATVDEICYCVSRKVAQMCRNTNVRNWPGLLIKAVPEWFKAPATELNALRAEKMKRRQREEILAREIHEDPSSSDADREWAASILNASTSISSQADDTEDDVNR